MRTIALLSLTVACGVREAPNSRPHPTTNNNESGTCTGQLAAPSPVYALKQGQVVEAEAVHLSNMLVTAHTDSGFFAQLSLASPGCDPDLGSRFSGVYAHVGGAPGVQRGDEIDLSGTVRVYYDQIQLSDVVTQRTAAGTASAAQVSLGQAAADPYEGVLIELGNLEVANPSPQPGPGDNGAGELELSDGRRVDDFAGYSPTANAGDRFASIVGVAAWRNGFLKVGPRDASDVQPDDDTCTPDCSGRVCGSDPVCGQSCGTCTTGTCNNQGQCETTTTGGPIVLSFGSSITTLTPWGPAARLSAVVTDPDGADDIVGGQLMDPSGSIYGGFATEEGASYEIDVSWASTHQVVPIEFGPGGTSRTFRAVFFDQAGHRTEADLVLQLQCDTPGLAACDGTCVDFQTDDNNCGGCGVTTDVEGHFYCVDGAPSCYYGAVCDGECTGYSGRSHCGSCTNDCEALALEFDHAVPVWDIDCNYDGDDTQSLCWFQNVRNDERISCDQFCGTYGMDCIDRGGSAAYDAEGCYGIPGLGEACYDEQWFFCDEVPPASLSSSYEFLYVECWCSQPAG